MLLASAFSGRPVQTRAEAEDPGRPRWGSGAEWGHPLGRVTPEERKVILSMQPGKSPGGSGMKMACLQYFPEWMQDLTVLAVDALLLTGLMPPWINTGVVVHLLKHDGGLREVTLQEELLKASDGLVVARVERVRGGLATGRVLSGMNVAYEKGRSATEVVDLDEAIWCNAEQTGAGVAEGTGDLWNWFPTAQPRVTDASMSAKQYPPEVCDWYAELDANHTVCFRTPWGTTAGIPRRGGFPQGAMSAAWRSKFAQDPMLRVLEERGQAYRLRKPPALEEEAGLGEPPAVPEGRSHSDDMRLWTPGWDGLEHNLGIISFAAPRLGIGWKPSKMFARGNEAAGPPPEQGLWVHSWAEGDGEVRVDQMEVVPVSAAKELLGVAKPRGGELEQYGQKIVARTGGQLGILTAKKLAWDEVRAGVQLGGVSMLQYAPTHARIEHEQARRLDAMIGTALRRGV